MILIFLLMHSAGIYFVDFLLQQNGSLYSPVAPLRLQVQDWSQTAATPPTVLIEDLNTDSIG